MYIHVASVIWRYIGFFGLTRTPTRIVRYSKYRVGDISDAIRVLFSKIRITQPEIFE